MKHRDAFSDYHPLVNLLYFGLVFGCAMFGTHPALPLAFLVCGLAYAAALKGKRAAWAGFCRLLPMVLAAALVNLAFNHEGATILAYLPSGNPLTLESFCYGLCAAALLAGAILWFACLLEVLPPEKWVYLFGRAAPALSLALSLTLRFVPLLQSRFRQVREARRCLGRQLSQGPLLPRLREAVTVVSILVTWSLENAVDTADSMKSRGYGLPGRTAFSIYRLEDRDKGLLLWLGFCGFYLACGWRVGALYWRWYPTLAGAPGTPFTASFPLVFLALCLTPVFLERREAAAWKHSGSRR